MAQIFWQGRKQEEEISDCIYWKPSLKLQLFSQKNLNCWWCLEHLYEFQKITLTVKYCMFCVVIFFLNFIVTQLLYFITVITLVCYFTLHSIVSWVYPWVVCRRMYFGKLITFTYECKICFFILWPQYAIFSSGISSKLMITSEP